MINAIPPNQAGRSKTCHTIPTEEEHEDSVSRAKLESVDYHRKDFLPGAVVDFRHTANRFMETMSSVLIHEAMEVKSRVRSLQNKIDEQSLSQGTISLSESESESSNIFPKRRKLSKDQEKVSPNENASKSSTNIESERKSILLQANRMKRLSLSMKAFEFLSNELMDEFMECESGKHFRA